MRPLTPRQAELICVPRFGEVCSREDIPVLVDLLRDGLVVVQRAPNGAQYVIGTPRLFRARRVHQAWLAAGGGR